MIKTELQSLLERVEAHGGPAKTGFPLWEDSWVGVLKRDLIERGLPFYTDWHPDPRPWTAEVRRNGEHAFKVRAYGDSELEAVLQAWLAAAEAEGWAP